MIAPDHVGRFTREFLDPVAAENFIALCVESVRSARNGPCSIDEARAGIRIEQRTDHRTRLLSGIVDTLSQNHGCFVRERANRALNQQPLIPRDPRHRRQMSAAIIAAFAARPVAMGRGDLFRARSYLLLNLIELPHLLH